uniref:Uncharacterized protein n=1 Tax=Pyricularia oryzae (strain P131) TaxID=1143193 RepID=L7J4A7_PYRO1
MQLRVPGTNDGLKVFVLSLIGELSGSLAAYSLLLYAAATQKSRSSAVGFQQREVDNISGRGRRKGRLDGEDGRRIRKAGNLVVYPASTSPRTSGEGGK